jgi:hypothetical protein
MSTNIHFYAKRDIIVKQNGKPDVQVKLIDVWQTSTEDTHKIIGSDNPIQAYIDWVLLNFDRDYKMPTYAPNDPFGDGEPIGEKIINEGREHVDKFKKNIAALESDGWVIVAEAW